MKQHRADGVSLIFGLIFLVIAAWWTIGELVDVDLNIPNFGWVLAVGLIVLGLVGVVLSLRGNDTATDAPPEEVTATTPLAPWDPPVDRPAPSAPPGSASSTDTTADDLPPVTTKED